MGAIGQITPQDYNKWLLAGKNQPVDKGAIQNPPTQQPVENQDYKLTGNFGWNVGGVTGVEGTSGAYGVGRTTPSAFLVQSEDGNNISYANSRGHVGCTEMAEGAGNHYDPLNGHAKHKTWFVA